MGILVIDDNYTAMQDVENTLKPVSAPILGTFSKMCPIDPSLAQPNSIPCIYNAPAKSSLTSAASNEPVVKAGETQPTMLDAGKPATQEVPGDVKQATTTGAQVEEKPSPVTQPSLEQTATAIILLGVITGVVYFGWKLIRP